MSYNHFRYLQAFLDLILASLKKCHLYSWGPTIITAAKFLMEYNSFDGLLPNEQRKCKNTFFFKIYSTKSLTIAIYLWGYSV